MEELLTKIGELIAVEIEEVESIEYTDKEMGYMFYINMSDGKKVLLSLIDSELCLINGQAVTRWKSAYRFDFDILTF